jgi:hypothetical protein
MKQMPDGLQLCKLQVQLSLRSRRTHLDQVLIYFLADVQNRNIIISIALEDVNFSFQNQLLDEQVDLFLNTLMGWQLEIIG